MEVLNNYFVGTTGTTDGKIINEYLSDKTNGYGKVLFQNETSTYTYNGPIVNGKLNGKGLAVYMTSSDKYKKYYGEFIDGKFNGSGTLTYTDGNIFIGQFKNGLKHGQGKMYNQSGDIIIDNIWKNDCVCGKVEYVEYFPQTKIPKLVGTMMNSSKIGPWVYYKDSDSNTILRIDYYENYSLDVSDTEIKEKLLKTLKTNTNGFISPQLFEFNNKLSLEDIIMNTFDIYKDVLRNKKNLNNLDKDDSGYSFDPNKYEKYAIPVDTTLINDNTLVVNMTSNGNIVSVGKYIDGKEQDYVVFLGKDQNKKNVSKYLVHNTLTNTKSLYEYNPESEIPLPTIHYEGEMLNDQPHGHGTIYEVNCKILYMGVFDHGQIVDGTHYNTNTGTPIYEGKFKNSKPDGEGKFYDDRGILIYNGMISAGKRNGHGISYYTSSGAMNWEGGWHNDMKHGTGRLYGEDGLLICICRHVNDNFEQVLDHL